VWKRKEESSNVFSSRELKTRKGLCDDEENLKICTAKLACYKVVFRRKPSVGRVEK